MWTRYRCSDRSAKFSNAAQLEDTLHCWCVHETDFVLGFKYERPCASVVMTNCQETVLREVDTSSWSVQGKTAYPQVGKPSRRCSVPCLTDDRRHVPAHVTGMLGKADHSWLMASQATFPSWLAGSYDITQPTASMFRCLKYTSKQCKQVYFWVAVLSANLREKNLGYWESDE